MRVLLAPPAYQHLMLSSVLDLSHSNRYAVVSCFYLQFSVEIWWYVSFYMLICHLYIFFAELSVHSICPFLKWAVFLIIELLSVPCVFGGQYIIKCVLCKDFLQIQNMYFILLTVAFTVQIEHFIYCFTDLCANLPTTWVPWHQELHNWLLYPQCLA